MWFLPKPAAHVESKFAEQKTADRVPAGARLQAVGSAASHLGRLPTGRRDINSAQTCIVNLLKSKTSDRQLLTKLPQMKQALDNSAK